MNHSGLITKDETLSSILLHDIELMTILNRFGISLGFGDKSIEEICKEHDIDLNFFMEIINIFHNTNYFPTQKLLSFSIQPIVEFLTHSHHYYNDKKIPGIKRLIGGLSWQGEQHDRNLNILNKFFFEYKNEVKAHTSHEEETVYPYAIFIEESCNKIIGDYEDCLNRMNNYSITDYASEHDNIEEKLTDLKNIIIKYLPPSNNPEKIYKILYELFKLEKDLSYHAQIEEKILVPMILQMEENLKVKISNLKK